MSYEIVYDKRVQKEYKKLGKKLTKRIDNSGLNVNFSFQPVHGTSKCYIVPVRSTIAPVQLFVVRDLIVRPKT